MTDRALKKTVDQKTFASAIDQICDEKGIPREKVIEAIEIALAAAYKKEFGRKGQNVRVDFDLNDGTMKIWQIKTVVDKSMLKEEDDETSESEAEEERQDEMEEGEDKKIRYNPEKHIMMEEAQEFIGKNDVYFDGKKLSKKTSKKKFEVDDELEFPLEVVSDFGRIAAQTAKQVVTQRIREAEREAVYEEYKNKEGQVVSGIIQRIERGNVFFDIGKATGVLFPEEQIPRENYRLGQRMKIYLMEVQKETHGPAILLSRAHPKMITELFTLEVPEISANTVEIKGIAREAGSRSKIAVFSSEERVDPIGSMIGQRGTRVQAVINELNGEKIDIVEWSEDLSKFIKNSLSPAKVFNVEVDKKTNQAKVTVPEDQLSLAIGVKGQNVRLAAKLTGCKIDIIPLKPDGEVAETETEEKKGKPTKDKKEKTKTKKKKTKSLEKKEEKPKKKKKKKKEEELEVKEKKKEE